MWNQWKKEEKPTIILVDLNLAKVEADLRRADLSGADLSGADLRWTDLREADLSGADLSEADLKEANLQGADLSGADLSGANLSQAKLSGVLHSFMQGGITTPFLGLTPSLKLKIAAMRRSEADRSTAKLSGAYLYGGADLSYTNLSYANLSETDLRGAHIYRTNLSHANLSDANLSFTRLVETNLNGAILRNCLVYGISAWEVYLQGATQYNLVITPPEQPTITVDNLEVAQFIYLLLNNPKIRDVIDTIAKKAVLILGRFTPERKAILDALREALRAQGYLPILFDFDKPSSQDLTETVSTLAHLSRFIIVDLTDPSSAPYEVGMIASNHIRPIQALFQPSDETKRVFAMFPDLVRRYHWVLSPYEYQDQEQLLASLQTKVIDPAEQKAQELEKR